MKLNKNALLFNLVLEVDNVISLDRQAFTSQFDSFLRHGISTYHPYKLVIVYFSIQVSLLTLIWLCCHISSERTERRMNLQVRLLTFILAVILDLENDSQESRKEKERKLKTEKSKCLRAAAAGWEKRSGISAVDI